MKHFPVYLDGPGRDHAARRKVRGVYRTKGDGLAKGCVKAPKSLHYNTGAKKAIIAAGVGNGKVPLWSEIEGNFSGDKAAALYKKAITKAIEKEHGKNARSRRVLEDNCPIFKSKKAGKAKAKAAIEVFPIPKRSPDLNPCDYFLWAQINKKMRAQELRRRMDWLQIPTPPPTL